MAETANILRAVVQQWRASTTLQTIPIDTTRAVQGESVGSVFPYCHLQAAIEKRMFVSAKYRITRYLVQLTLYAGNDKTILNTSSDSIDALFDMNIGLPVAQLDNCYCLSARNVEDTTEVDENDFYGADVNRLKKTYSVLLNETITAVYSALAT